MVLLVKAVVGDWEAGGKEKQGPLPLAPPLLPVQVNELTHGTSARLCSCFLDISTLLPASALGPGMAIPSYSEFHLPYQLRCHPCVLYPCNEATLFFSCNVYKIGFSDVMLYNFFLFLVFCDYTQ